MENNHITPNIEVHVEDMITKLQEYITVAERMLDNKYRDFIDYEYEGDTFDFERKCNDEDMPIQIRLLSDFIYNLKNRDGIVNKRKEAYAELFKELKEEASGSKEKEAIDFFITMLKY